MMIIMGLYAMPVTPHVQPYILTLQDPFPVSHHGKVWEFPFWKEMPEKLWYPQNALRRWLV
jgi:hypothetical protein